MAGQTTTDEKAFNLALAAGHMKVAVLGRSLAHHYSFSKCEDYLRSHMPLERVWRFMQGLPDALPVAGRRRAPALPGDLRLLRVGG